VRPLTRVIPALVCALALIVPAQAPAAHAATDAGYTVTPGLTFNNPTGSLAQHRRIITVLEKAIDNAPPGSRIRMAQYLFNLDSTADKLIAAHLRGVVVQLLIDDYPSSVQTLRVRKALGTRKSATKSFVARCVNSCMSSETSVMHAKFFLFSQSGVSRNVSMVSSANPYTGNTSTSWNNLHVIVGDTTIYASLNKYFDDMLPDIDRPNYYRTTTSGIHKLYFFPRAARAGSSDIPLLDVLNNVRCTGLAAGYGSDGRTVVRIEQWGWSAARLDIARRVWDLHNQGCKVQIIANSFNTGPRVLEVLLRRSSRYGQIPFYNAAIDTNGNGVRDKYMHHKVLMINGKWFGQSTKVVYTGSANFSGTATLANNEIILRVKHAKTYDAYYSNFNYIRNNWTKRVTRPPSIATSSPEAAAEVERKLEARMAASPDTF
jgi:phosphatidylserine/phosphatidylglycerophosphate/cardiolipin synthase-like enzyme